MQVRALFIDALAILGTVAPTLAATILALLLGVLLRRSVLR